MRCSILLTVVLFAADIAVVSADQGGLFSEVAMESVFDTSASKSSSVATPGNRKQFDRITGVSSLIEALRAAEFEPQEKSGRASFELRHGGWKLPVSLGVQVDRDRIDCQMSLVQIADDSRLNTETLLELLASSDGGDAAFSYDREGKRLLLKTSWSNRSVTSAGLKADLLRLASIAEQHQKTWSKLSEPAKAAANVEKPQSKELSLVGRWSASVGSDQAFAIQIASDSTFQLVHLKSGKSTVSKGKIERSGDQLKLAGNALTLNCTVSQTTADAFQLAIKNAKGAVTATLNFKKAK